MARAVTPDASVSPTGLTSVAVSGYKSIAERQAIEIVPLTVLSGPNSSGKSSMMQPLLLLKQTLEVGYDPGVIMISGPCISFNRVKDLRSLIPQGRTKTSFCVELRWDNQGEGAEVCYEEVPDEGLAVQHMSLLRGSRRFRLSPSMSTGEIIRCLPDGERALAEYLTVQRKLRLEIRPDRCFLDVVGTDSSPRIWPMRISHPAEYHLTRVIYLPGLRGNPARSYPVTGRGPTFPGRFEKYTAGVLANWQRANDDRLGKVCEDLRSLGLSARVAPEKINDVEIQLSVSRLGSSSEEIANDLVSIADVGLGVSQVLPVIVALRAARPGQLVYLEQPEIHLHPRAQSSLVNIIADASRRGVRVVLETHSHLILLGVQTLVAAGYLSPKDVRLHWFALSPTGQTQARTAQLDEQGSFGDWPEDFASTLMEAQRHYVTTAWSRHGGDQSG